MNNIVPSCWIRNIKMLTICIFVLFLWVDVVSASQFTPILIGKTKDTIFRMSLISADLKITCNEQRISFDWLLTYSNPLDEWIEGELTMPMLKNQLITGFDMNVGDDLRKGMIAEKMLAKSTYERIVARNNDPGLLEIVKGNSIKLRVFPILQNENKRVRISYDCDFDYDAENQIFKLDYPFDFIDNLEYFTIELDASNVNLPLFIESNINELEINQKGKSKLKLKDFKGINFFKFMYRDKFEKPIVTLSKFDDEKYFSALVKSPLSNLECKKVNSITMFVDASLSQKKNDFRAERYFLKEYLKKVGNAEIELIVFSLYELDRAKFKVEAGNSDEIIAYLDSIEYIGATNYGSIDISNIKSDIVIMLSNGVKNLGECDFMSIGKPVYFVNSNPDFDEAYCKNISEKSGGKFINLDNNDKLYATVMSMFEMPISITKVKSSDEFSDIMISKHLEKLDIYRITGKFKSQDEKINLTFSDGTESEIDFEDLKIKASNSVPRLWASDRVNSLMLESKIDTAEIVRLSKKHSFATKLTSFIVLETARQYLFSGIDPPPDLKKEYDEEKAESDEWDARYLKDNMKHIDNEKKRQLVHGKKELEELKFNYYDYYKDFFEYVRIYQVELNINWVNLLSKYLSEREQTGFILPIPYIYEQSKYKFLKSITFLKNGHVIDTSDSFFIPKIDHDFDSICIKLMNNDNIKLPCNIEKGKLNVIDLDIIDEFRKRGIGFGDITILVRDSTEKFIDSCYAVINSRFTEILTKQNNQIKNLLTGDNHFYIYDNSREYNSIYYNIKAGQDNKIVLDAKEIKSHFNYGIIDTDANGYCTLVGFVSNEDGKGLRGASVFIEGTQKGAAVRENSGRFIITGILPGEYTVRFSFTGRKTERKKVIVYSNKTVLLGLIRLFDASVRTEELMLLSAIDDGREGNNTSIDLLHENLKADIDSIFELAEQYLKTGDTTWAEILLSGIYDIDNEKAGYMYKLSAYFCRVNNLELAIDAYQRTQYFEPDSIYRDFKLARIYEDCGKPDSALKLYEKLVDYSYLRYSYVLNEIERRRLYSLVNKEELNEDDKIDLLIRTESYEFNHELDMKIILPNGFEPYWYFDNYFGCFRLKDPVEAHSYIQKQKIPGTYKIKLNFDTWRNQTEITNKYRGRVIIDRNIGSLNYSRQVIEVEADSLEQEIEIEILD